MFINLSNHPSEKWSDKQLEEAKKYGDVVDMQFPQISTELTSADIDALVFEYYLKIKELIPVDFFKREVKKSFVVMVQGEFIFTYRLVSLLKNEEIMAVAARTERVVKEIVEDGIPKKVSEFNFAGFMEY
jgi:hypothetical protein